MALLKPLVVDAIPSNVWIALHQHQKSPFAQLTKNNSATPTTQQLLKIRLQGALKRHA